MKKVVKNFLQFAFPKSIAEYESAAQRRDLAERKACEYYDLYCEAYRAIIQLKEECNLLEYENKANDEKVHNLQQTLYANNTKILV